MGMFERIKNWLKSIYNAIVSFFGVSGMRRIRADEGGKKSKEQVSVKLAATPPSTNTQNSKLQTSKNETIAPRLVGQQWHTPVTGVGKIMGLKGLSLQNTSHGNVQMNGGFELDKIERTPVSSVHSKPKQVLQPGVVDPSMDFLSGPQITNSKSGRLMSYDIRDHWKNRGNLVDWPRHGGVRQSHGPLELPAPAYGKDKTPYGDIQLRNNYPIKVSDQSAQGFFSGQKETNSIKVKA